MVINKQQQQQKTQAGFTLIELMVVLLIIGILAAIAIPTYLTEKSKANNTAAETTTRNALTALDAVYASQNAYVVPTGSSAANLADYMAGQEPSLKWANDTSISAINNVSISTFDAINTGTSASTTGEPQGIEVTAWSAAGKCFTAIEIQMSSTGLTPGTYYEIGSQSGGACTPPSAPTSTSGLATTWSAA